MGKLTVTTPTKYSLNKINAVEMKIGQIALYNYGKEVYHVLKTYSGIVALEDPSKTWETATLYQLRVTPLNNVSVTLNWSENVD